MQFKNRIFCNHETIMDVNSNNLYNIDSSLVISIVDEKNKELMIFIGEADSGSVYEVRIYKNKPTDEYVQCKEDEVVWDEECDEYTTLIFKTFENARTFVETLKDKHPEYAIRPVRKIEWIAPKS